MSAVRQELETRLLNWAAAQTPPIRVALENVPFSKPADYSLFVEAFIIPAYTKDVTVDGQRQRELGIFQINIWAGDGKGSGPAERVLDSLKSVFKLVPKIGLVSIERTLSASRAILSDGWRITPVTTNYRYES